MTPLRRRMTEDLTLHNYSPKTARRYIKWVADFAQHFHTSPEHLGPEHVRSYLLHLIQERKITWSVHREARHALQFLYRVTLGREEVVEKVAHPKAPKTLPVVLSQDEMARFLVVSGVGLQFLLPHSRREQPAQVLGHLIVTSGDGLHDPHRALLLPEFRLPSGRCPGR
jgi:site-specific recombinase XerD